MGEVTLDGLTLDDDTAMALVEFLDEHGLDAVLVRRLDDPDSQGVRADAFELVAYKQVPAILGVKSPNVDKVPDLPDPVAVLPAGRIWLRADLLEAAQRRQERREAAGR